MMPMSNKKYRKLELTWYNKDKVLVWNKDQKEYIWVEPNDLRASETRILKKKSTIGEPNSTFDIKKGKWIKSDKTENILINGENLLSLKSLEPEFNSKIKLIYIDPPFNTGSRINTEGKEVGYDDGLEHSIWLSMMKDRLNILYRLLSEDGSIFVHIDEKELGHLKILLDEIFSRKNFITLITIKRSAPTGHKTINPSPVNITDYILGYAKNKEEWKYSPQFVGRARDKAYNKFIENYDDPFEKWKFISLNSAFTNAFRAKSLKGIKKKLGKEFENEMDKFIINNRKRVVRFAIPNYGGVGKKVREIIDKSKKVKKVLKIVRKDFPNMYFFGGNRILFYKDKLKRINGELTTGELLTNIWDDIPFQGIANEGDIVFRKGKKPEAMIKRIIKMASNENDWILDSFAGSGTTGAVAHKLGRRWIMIELGPHAKTHALKRMTSVVDGSDKSGISKEVNWNGGGGFNYFILGESLFKKNDIGMIEVNYDNGDLIEAVCKLEGFKFVGREFLDKTKLHGVVNGKRYCHISEDLVTQDYVEEILSEIKEDESLVIYCMKKMSRLELPENVEVKKIPIDIMKRFSFG